MSAKSPLRSSERHAAGLTLVEILVGLLLLGILLAIAAPSMADLLEKRRVIAAADELVSLVNYAKAETRALDQQLALHTGTVEDNQRNHMSCAAVTTSGALDPNCSCYNAVDNMCPSSPLRGLRAFQLPLDHVSFSTQATWTNNNLANQIIFSPGQVGPAGASDYYFEVVGQRRGYRLQVQLNAAGRIRVCAPNGDMSGYPRCA